MSSKSSVSKKCTNYTVRGDKAYTEDKLLIFNVFVDISKKMTEREVQSYFEQFGAVKNVHILRCKFRTRGFVNFVEASSAAKAIQWQYTFLETENEYICVSAADSWNQPHANQPCSAEEYEKHGIVNKINKKNCLNIWLLNNYCLENIIHGLNLSGQVRFARVCPRFYQIFHNYCKRAYKNFNCNMIISATRFEIRYFFRYFGEHVENVAYCIRKERRREIEFVPIFCKNLTSLNLEFSQFCPIRLLKLLRKLKTLKELNLGWCSLDDEQMAAVFQISTLEILHLSWNTEITGAYIRNLQQLRVLHLNGCTEVQLAHLIRICESFPRLTSLDIRSCDLSTDVFNAMIQHCQQLEVLKISCFAAAAYETVALLPSLKELILARHAHSFFEINWTQILKDLVRYKSHQLEVFRFVSRNTLNVERIELISQLKELRSVFLAHNQAVNEGALLKLCQLEKLEKIVLANCCDITNEGVLALLRSCKNLRHLNIQLCSKINRELISKAVFMLEQRMYTLKVPVVLLVHGTLITDSELSQIPEYNAATKESLLKVDCSKHSTELGEDDEYDFVVIRVQQDEDGRHIL